MLKQIGKIIRSSRIGLTGRTRQLKSRLTGKMTIYHESYSIYVTSPAPTAPDLEAIKQKIDQDLLIQSVDGFCDEILAIQGIIQDTYKPRLWIAEEQPTLEAKLGTERLIAPGIIMALIYAITIIAAAIIVIAVVYLLTNSFMTIAEWVAGPPKYVGGTPDAPVVYESWSEYLSGQNLLYWYVCPKCGAGYGLKETYPKIEDVPQAEVDAFNEHVENCLGIPQDGEGPGLIVLALGVGLAIVGLWAVAKIFGRR